MDKKQSTFDFGILGAIIGGILLIVIPILVILAYSEHNSSEPCDRDCEYYRDNQPEKEPSPIDLNGDGIITRDEFEEQ